MELPLRQIFVRPRAFFIFFFLVVLAAPFSLCQNLGFDLSGPPVDVRVERNGKTLPIAEVPSLQPGDRLWVHPDFPDSQSVRYLLIVTFLRGSTNPPPDEWFTRADTWEKSVREEGIFVTVPKEAQQAIIFLAPQATGDFSTLRAAVRGRPSAFVRSSQDLQQASFDRLRLERYLDEVKSVSEHDPGDLQSRSVLLAHNLKIKVDSKCFDKPVEQQYTCLTQNSDQLILDDTNSQNMLARVSSGATADLMNQISYSRLGGGGAYSAYIGAIIDFGRIMGSLHSAQYQYIPALALPRGDALSLKLNNPPSFRKPQSVLVIALPPVQKASPPDLRATQNESALCLGTPNLILPAEGAPLVFATHYAHDMNLRLEDGTGKKEDVPIVADPARGGFELNSTNKVWSNFEGNLSGTIHGMWGFDTFNGPKYRLQVARPQRWTIPARDRMALIVGREDVLHLAGQDTGCIARVTLHQDGKDKDLAWKLIKPQSLEIKVPLQDRSPEPVKVEISQHGLSKPDEVTAQSYSEAAQFDRFILNAGDSKAVLEGKRLDEVGHLQLAGIQFAPADLTRRADHDELSMTADGSTDGMTQSDPNAAVVLKDGRTFKLAATILPPRPRLDLIGKTVQSDDPNWPTVHMGSDNELPATGRIVFSVKSIVPPVFNRGEQVEVAAVDGSFHTILNLSDGNLVLQDPQTALGTIDPKKSFGPSAFGPLRFRAVSADGTLGDWQPLGTLVRLPSLKEVSCPPVAAKACSLTGTNLFLLSAISASADFDDPTLVPDGFTGQSLPVERPPGGVLYFKLRDDSSVVQSATVPVVKESPTGTLVRSGAHSESKK